jgi:DNA-binding MarR family transcriptional regulator
MMTADADPTDTWASISELARIRGVQKSAISKRVARLELEGLVHPRPGPLNSKEINVAEFERACDQTTDAVRETNGCMAKQSNAANVNSRRRAAIQVADADMDGTPSDPILAKEQARKTKIQADLAQLQLDELKGLLVRTDDISAGATIHGETLGRVIDHLHGEATALAAAEDSPFAKALRAAMRSDSSGARSFFKTLARKQRDALANAFAALAEVPGEVTAEAPLEMAG